MTCGPNRHRNHTSGGTGRRRIGSGDGRARRDSGGGCRGRRVLCDRSQRAVQQSLMSARQVDSRIHAQLVGEHGAALVEDTERVGLAPAPVEGGHQLGAHPLAQREVRDQAGQFGDDVPVAAECEIGLDPGLQRGGPAFLPLRRLLVREEPGDVAEEGPLPEIHRAVEQGARFLVAVLRERLPAEPVQTLVLDDVHPALSGHEDVAGRAPFQGDLGFEEFAQSGDVRVDLRALRGGWVGAPQQLADPGVRHHTAPGEQQRGQEGVHFRARERDPQAPAAGLDRAEQMEIHGSPFAWV